MDRREFLNILAIASAAGLPISSRAALVEANGGKLYDVPRFGNVSLLHMTDCHAQLMPIYFREPNVNLGIAAAKGRAPHLVGEHFLKSFGVDPRSAQAHAFTYLDFAQAAKTYGKVGGFAHLATLVKNLKATRPERCCSTAVTPGRAAPRLSGRTARTWSTPARPSAWT